jgi:hypothetical protein
MANSLIAVYKTVADAETAVKSLRDGGYPINEVSIIAKDLKDSHRLHAYVTSSDEATATGAFFGGIFGLLAGAAFVWAPGFGPLVVAGTIAAEVLGFFEGAAAGAIVAGMLGWLVKFAVSEEKIWKYEHAVKAGKALVAVTGPEELIPKAHAILERTSPEQLELHAPVTA